MRDNSFGLMAFSVLPVETGIATDDGVLKMD